MKSVWEGVMAVARMRSRRGPHARECTARLQRCWRWRWGGRDRHPARLPADVGRSRGCSAVRFGGQVSGTGAFAGLHVTVSQTRNLINQAVTMSWTGGISTLLASGQFARGPSLRGWQPEPLIPIISALIGMPPSGTVP